jgi:hypothetical protein
MNTVEVRGFPGPKIGTWGTQIVMIQLVLDYSGSTSVPLTSKPCAST